MIPVVAVSGGAVLLFALVLGVKRKYRLVNLTYILLGMALFLGVLAVPQPVRERFDGAFVCAAALGACLQTLGMERERVRRNSEP